LLLVAAGAGGIWPTGWSWSRDVRFSNSWPNVTPRSAPLTEGNQALETAVRLLRHTERRARTRRAGPGTGPEGHVRTRVRFFELDAQGNPVGEPRELVLDGDEVYVEALVIKFEDTFVTAGDALKGKASLLFRRIFTDRRRPTEGDVLDREGQMPQSYAAERAPAPFERELWARFWELANDPEAARQRGVRALHGEAVSTRLRKDRIDTISYARRTS
jgi:hypothetical protein